MEFSQEDEISAARDNVGSAAQAAAGLGGPPGDALREAANIAFMDAIGIALLAAAASSFAGALLLLRFARQGLAQFKLTPNHPTRKTSSVHTRVTQPDIQAERRPLPPAATTTMSSGDEQMGTRVLGLVWSVQLGSTFHSPNSPNPACPSGRGPSSQWYFLSDSRIGRSLMLARRRCIRPLGLNSQFSLP